VPLRKCLKLLIHKYSTVQTSTVFVCSPLGSCPSLSLGSPPSASDGSSWTLMMTRTMLAQTLDTQVLYKQVLYHKEEGFLRL